MRGVAHIRYDERAPATGTESVSRSRRPAHQGHRRDHRPAHQGHHRDHRPELLRDHRVRHRDHRDHQGLLERQDFHRALGFPGCRPDRDYRDCHQDLHRGRDPDQVHRGQDRAHLDRLGHQDRDGRDRPDRRNHRLRR